MAKPLTIVMDPAKFAAVQARLAALPERLRPELLKVGGAAMKDYMTDVFRTSGGAGGMSWASPAGGGRPLDDEGILKQSFVVQVTEEKATLAVIGPAKVYAGVQHRGDTIVAKNKFKGVPGGPYLSIPLPGLSHVQRKEGLRAFDWKSDRLFVAKSRNDHWLVFQTVTVAKGVRAGKVRKAKSKFATRWTPGQKKQGTEAVIRPLFALEKSVKITPRPFMCWTAQMLSKALRAMDLRAKAIVRRAVA